MAWYKTGSVTIVQGQTSVSGTGTRFAANARVGDAFRGPDGLWYEVVNIASEVTLGIYPAYQGASVTANTNYVIAPMQGYVKDSADRLRKITDSIADISSDVAEARASAEAAALSETNAASSESSALESKNAAGVSETNAKASETAAAASQVAAKTSETNSKTSETNAKTSETNAKASETAANTSKNAAAASATAAAGSQTAAGNSATAAATSESNALASKNAAAASQAAAAASQNAAKTSETNAKTSETNASTSATQADNSATLADGSRTAALSSENKAKAWAENPVNTAVETDKYSALHWATKAKESADAAGAVTGPRLTSIATAVLAVNDMLIADSTNTMSKIATSESGRVILSGTPAQSRTALELGTVSTMDVTTSSTDTTANRILKVGDFGLGAAQTPTMSDLTGTWYSGFYLVPANSPGLPSEALSSGGVFLALRVNFGILISLSVAAESRMTWTGVRSGATGEVTWSPIGVGSNGLGLTTAPTITDFADASISGGFYTAFTAGHPNATPNGPPGATSAGGFSVIAAGGVGSNYKGFLAMQNNQSGSGQKTYVGVKGQSGAPVWREVYTNVSSVGTVSQAGGVPTGAIIERGSNSNGDYTRYADGTQICGVRLTAPSLAIDIAHVGAFRSGQATWTFPMPFTSSPHMVAVPEVARANGCVVGNVLSAQGGIFFTNPITQSNFDRIAHVTAYGRWY